VRVHEQPTIGIFSTGDELVDAGTGGAAVTLKPGQIFDANRTVLTLLLRTLPIRLRDFGIIPDDRARIRAVLEEADASCAMVVTSGGVSVGDADWVKDVVSDIGTIRMWKLNLKPGKPLAYGRLRSAAFFGLPGNPVSAIVTAMMLVRPAIERLCGSRPTPLLSVPATLRGSLAHQPGREEFQRGTLRSDSAGLEVSVTGDQSSNRLASFAAANCLIRIPKDCADLSDGRAVTVLPFRGVL
jgi:molybdopterin molybdotransferase